MKRDKYEEMHELYQSGKTMKEIGEMFNLTTAAVSKGFKTRGYETRDSSWPRKRDSILAIVDDTALLDTKAAWDGLDSKVKGTIVENYVNNRLAEQGFDVWIPYINNQKADLGIYRDGRLLRIQVKGAIYDAQTKRFRAMLQTRDKNGLHINYNEDDIDFFIVYCPGVTPVYIIPAPIGCVHHSVNMLPHRERLYRGTGVNWEEYRDAFHLLRG